MDGAVESCRHRISEFLAAARDFGGFGYDVYWALEQPYPLALESELSCVWPVYEALADHERESLRVSFDYGDMMLLFAYAARMATFAVRQRDSKYLRHALLAVSVGREDIDYRDAAITRVLLIDAARRLDAVGLFAEVAPQASASMQSFFRDADYESRALQSMGFIVTEDTGDGFRYRKV